MRTGPRPPTIRQPNFGAFGTMQQSIGSAYPAIVPLLIQGQQVTGLPERFPGQTKRTCPTGFELGPDGRCVRKSNPSNQMWAGGPNYGKFDWGMRYGGSYTYAWPASENVRHTNPCCSGNCGDEMGQNVIGMPAYQEERIDLRNATDRFGAPTYGGQDPYSIWDWNVRNATPYGNGQYGLQYSNMTVKSPSLPAAQPGTWPVHAPMTQTPCATAQAYGVTMIANPLRSAARGAAIRTARAVR